MSSNAVRIELKLEGIEQFERYVLKIIPNGISNAADEALTETAEEARDIAKTLVPIGTPESTGIRGYVGGSLQKSIRIERHAQPKGNIRYVGIRAGGYIINPNTGRIVDYAVWVEKGNSRGIYPRPYMQPALRRAMRKLPGRYWRALARRVEMK